jgi:hypothetical protein
MKGPAIPLSIAFGVASAVAFAQTNDPVAQLRACSAMERVERLKCLDDLSRNMDPAVGPAQADKWIVSETTSPVDYTPIVTANTSSRGPDGSSMQLSIFCRSGRTEMVVAGSALSSRGGDYAATYSINGNQPVRVPTGSPSFGTGVAFQGDVVRLLQSLPDEGEIAIHLGTRTAAAVDLSFSLGGLKMVQEKMATACKWPSAVASPRP